MKPTSATIHVATAQGDPQDSAGTETFKRAIEGAVVELARQYDYSAAEMVVARCLARGLGRKDIAVLRRRSERTIQSQIRTLLQKTRVHSANGLRAEILRLALVTALGE